MQPSQYDRLRSAVAGRFLIERELGHGGMATVFRAEDLKNHRPVALKVLRPEVGSVIGEERFRREIEIVGGLQHPHILPLYDSDAADGFLYFIMPLVEGGTLRDRLARSPELPTADCLAIARQVAMGLGHAHARGLVHRDIKPANILLSGEHALIGDFGIARLARSLPEGDRLTETGLVIGTPTYMAPEQLRGAPEVDGRADQYALACVLYEMLTGAPPSPAARGPDTIQHSLRKARPDLPGRVIAAVIRALAQDPDGRFPAIAAFARELEPEPVFRPEQLLPGFLRRAKPWVRWTVVGSTAAALALAIWLLPPTGGTECLGVPPADTTLYAVFPFRYDSAAPRLSEEQLLADAIERWEGVHVMDQFQLREALGRAGRQPRALGEARQAACRAGVRRFVLGTVQRAPGTDSVRVAAALYDLGPDELPLGRATVRLPAALDGADTLFGRLADSLLFRGNPPAEGVARAGTRQLPALQAFDSGQRALAAWNLAAADTAFHRAAAWDPAFASANLWLALVRMWQHREPALWLPAAQRAAAGEAGVRAGDSLMAVAAVETGSGAIERACPVWRGLTVAQPRRFAAWYGLSDCLRRDSIVVRDARSPSGWRFRSSYHEAQRAYLTAIRLLPSILAAPGNDVGTLSNELLYLAVNKHRKGQSGGPSGATFWAAPAWVGDSLVFIPQPHSTQAPATNYPPGPVDEAIRRQRLLLDTLALTWVTEAPQSVEARLALVEAMALAIDPAAVDSARGARRLARDSAQLVAVLDAEIRTLLQFGTPDRPDHLERARRLADSVITTPQLRQAAEPEALAAMAALTGRASLAADAARRSAASPDWDLPKPLLEAAPGLLMYAAMGGPADSIRTLWRLTRDAIDQALAPDRRLERAMEDLGRPATLAFPAETLPSLFELRNMGDWLLTLQADFAEGDRRVVLRWADSSARAEPSRSWTFDTVWPLAALFLAAGDTAHAAARLDASLGGIRFRPFGSFGNPVEVATMVRSMMLRAELAGGQRDATAARRWARAVVALWGGADAVFAADLGMIRQLAD